MSRRSGDRTTEETPTLTLNGVSKHYWEGGKRHPVLRNLNVSFPAGESAALVGRSGSGKTTLLNLIAGIDRPSAGTIFFGGTPLHGLKEPQITLFRRRRIGFVYQFFNLLPTLTALENVLLPMELNRLRDREARARELLRAMGLEDRAGAYPDRLSGGEQQRIAIARALAHNPDILLADEPTGNLDAATARDVMILLTNLARKGGKTLIIVTHSEEVAARADRIFRMEEGRLVTAAPRRSP